jgi:hypothetical protein
VDLRVGLIVAADVLVDLEEYVVVVKEDNLLWSIGFVQLNSSDKSGQSTNELQTS